MSDSPEIQEVLQLREQVAALTAKFAERIPKAEHNRVVTDTIISLDAERAAFEQQIADLTAKLADAQASVKQEIGKVSDFLCTVRCSCAHSNPHSSQEWDRQHESWCPAPGAQQLLDQLRKAKP